MSLTELNFGRCLVHILLYPPSAVQLDLFLVTFAALTCKPLHNAPELL